MMYAAGGTRTKANAAEVKALSSKRSSNVVRSSKSVVRASVRNAYSVGGTKSSLSANATPALKSKFTERHAMPTASSTIKSKFSERHAMPTASTALKTKPKITGKRSTALHTLKREVDIAAATVASAASRKKPIGGQGIALRAQPKQNTAGTLARLSQPKRVWNSNLHSEAVTKMKTKIEEQQLVNPPTETVEAVVCHDVGVQTYEREIRNYDMLVGDNKFILPSKELVLKIEKKREDDLRQKLLKTERQFEEHSEHFGEHVSNLKEFLETGKITRRNKVEKSTYDLQMDRKVMQQMDEFLKRKVPKAESMTNIKERIKKKESELLSLFDSVEKIQI